MDERLTSEQMDQRQLKIVLACKNQPGFGFGQRFGKPAACQQQAGIQQELEQHRKIVVIAIGNLVQTRPNRARRFQLALVEGVQSVPVHLQ